MCAEQHRTQKLPNAREPRSGLRDGGRVGAHGIPHSSENVSCPAPTCHTVHGSWQREIEMKKSREITSHMILFIKLKTITIFKNAFHGIHMAAVKLYKVLSKGMMDRGFR